MLQLPLGPEGLDLRKIQKSPLYSVRAIKDVLFQDPAALETYNNFYSVLPMFQGYCQQQYLMEQQRRQEAEKEKEEEEQMKERPAKKRNSKKK